MLPPMVAPCGLCHCHCHGLCKLQVDPPRLPRSISPTGRGKFRSHHRSSLPPFTSTDVLSALHTMHAHTARIQARARDTDTGQISCPLWRVVGSPRYSRLASIPPWEQGLATPGRHGALPKNSKPTTGLLRAAWRRSWPVPKRGGLLKRRDSPHRPEVVCDAGGAEGARSSWQRGTNGPRAHRLVLKDHGQLTGGDCTPPPVASGVEQRGTGGGREVYFLDPITHRLGRQALKGHSLSSPLQQDGACGYNTGRTYT
jgi:hypothetical protein